MSNIHATMLELEYWQQTAGVKLEELKTKILSYELYVGCLAV